jgi:hypothetical protein
MKTIKIKLWFRPSYKDETKKEWHLAILTVDGVEHATGDLRTVYGEEDEMCIGTSLSGLSGGTVRKGGAYESDDDIPKSFEMREIEAELLDTDWKTIGISHTNIKHKDIIP